MKKCESKGGALSLCQQSRERRAEQSRAEREQSRLHGIEGELVRRIQRQLHASHCAHT